MKTHGSQLGLDIQLRVNATFSAFYSEGNSVAFDCLHAMTEPGFDFETQPQVYCWGCTGTGKTHLLQAFCQQLGEQSIRSVYLPLKDLYVRGPLILEDIGQLPFVCVDDLDVIAGHNDWEQAFFNLLNICRETKCSVVLASNQNPAYLKIRLPDLASRILWGPVFQLKTLDDEHKLKLIQQRALIKGIEISDDVGKYLLSRYSRGVQELVELLEQLDKASLAAQRRITVPFIKSVMSAAEP